MAQMGQSECQQSARSCRVQGQGQLHPETFTAEETDPVPSQAQAARGDEHWNWCKSWGKSRCHVCVYKQMQNMYLLLLLGRENAFVQDLVSGASLREEMAHLFININELVVFKKYNFRSKLVCGD